MAGEENGIEQLTTIYYYNILHSQRVNLFNSARVSQPPSYQVCENKIHNSTFLPKWFIWFFY